MLRVCIVALNAYPVIEPSARGIFGGIETRSWLFARALAQIPQVQVDFVIRHCRRLKRDCYDGVKLHLWLDRLYPLRDSVLSRVTVSKQFPWLKVKHPSPNLLWQLPLLAGSKLLRGRNRDPRVANPLLSTIEADVFLTFGVQGNSATVIASAHATGRPAVLFLGSDGDLDERYARDGEFISVYRDRAEICRWALQNADVIIAQTDRQRRLLQERFGREAKVVANPIDVEDWEHRRGEPVHDPAIASLDRYALWIGRAEAEHKRPQVCVELARSCPGICFLMILNSRDDVVERMVHQTAPANVTIVRSVPFAQIPAVFERAAVLVNTSSLEGFPNTFLQAALAEVPVASLVVEGGFLRMTGLGAACDGDTKRLAHLVESIWRGECCFDVASAKARVVAEHGLIPQAKKLEQVLRHAVGRDTAASR